MDRPHQNRPDGFGDRPATVEAPVTIDQPYGARTLGATTDQLPAAAADPRAISASIAGPGVAPLQLRHADGGEHDDPAEAATGEISESNPQTGSATWCTSKMSARPNWRSAGASCASGSPSWAR